MKNPKSCIDVILGAICLTSGVRDLEGYIQDMEERKQDKERIAEVIDSLKLYDQALKSKKTTPVRQKNQLDKVHEEFKNMGLSSGDPHNKYHEDLKKMSKVFKG